MRLGINFGSSKTASFVLVVSALFLLVQLQAQLVDSMYLGGGGGKDEPAEDLDDHKQQIIADHLYLTKLFRNLQNRINSKSDSAYDALRRKQQEKLIKEFLGDDNNSSGDYEVGSSTDDNRFEFPFVRGFDHRVLSDCDTPELCKDAFLKLISDEGNQPAGSGARLTMRPSNKYISKEKIPFKWG